MLKDNNGYYIIRGIGNIIYLPEKPEEIADFIDDWFTNPEHATAYLTQIKNLKDQVTRRNKQIADLRKKTEEQKKEELQLIDKIVATKKAIENELNRYCPDLVTLSARIRQVLNATVINGEIKIIG
jgi:predicted RNase H-like nuclease (RuvC/YqgF family)